ncbi:porin family protein [Aureibacter tunicatorum]|uniref:Outer membrane protein beta-barrel domain-containing protein n=1 Tax=Aureibacter tunicatorum TaxID=866807 RepID=A0AAE3XJA2_9BACT|nr:porin family protein [Aureibacter tunicatorum]MDR6237425.1 hypothetical protein [Aureibacter tunicatorum]BDD06415.1 hypothetical protein AUTU_38980 [Aureibacter tunicatorum]
MRTIKFLGLLCFFVMSSIVVRSQEKEDKDAECIENLNTAKRKYDEGKIHEIPSLLENCLKSGQLKKTELSEAYKLLTLTYLYYNEKYLAIETMTNFISLNPDYKIVRATDPAEFIKLFNSFRKEPIFLWGFKVGVNMPMMNEINGPTLGQSSAYNGSFKGKVGFSVGPEIDLHLYKGLNLSLGGIFSYRSYNFTEQLFQDNFMSINALENSYLIDLPLSFKYFFKGDKQQFFVSLGAYTSFLTQNSLTVQRTDVAGDISDSSVESPSIDFSENRSSMRYGALTSVGVMLKNKNNLNMIGIELSYNFGFNNIVNTTERYSSELNRNTMLTYGYLDKDVSENYLTLSVSYKIPKYNPKFKNKTKVKMKKYGKNRSKIIRFTN